MVRRGTDNVTLRIGEPLWRDFGLVASPDRSRVLRDFIAWYTRQPGAKMPKRPSGQLDEE